MLRRRKLKPIKLDPETEAWHAQEHEKLVMKARRIMDTFDTLPPVVRRAFTMEPTGGIMTSDAKGLADKISRGELPPNVDHAYLANHIVACGETNYRQFMEQERSGMEARPVAVFRKKPHRGEAEFKQGGKPEELAERVTARSYLVGSPYHGAPLGPAFLAFCRRPSPPLELELIG